MEITSSSDRIVVVKVQQRLPGVVLSRSDPLQRHSFGLSAAPLYVLQQPFASNESWEVSVNLNGQHLEGKAALSASLPDWVTQIHGTQALDMLPSGEYFIVRCPITPTPEEFVYFGNEAIRATPNTQVLFKGTGPVDALVVGAPEDARPCLAGPLIGIVVCHHTGVRFPANPETPSQHLLVLFSFCSGSANVDVPHHDVVCVFPISGELVVDHLQLSTANTSTFTPVIENPAFKVEWKDRFAKPLALALAGG